MQVPGLDAALQTGIPTASGVPARVLGGNLALIPLGSLLQATVTTVTPRDATLSVNGQTLTVRTPPGVQLQPGAALFVRVPPGAPNAPNPTLELSPANAARGQQAASGTARLAAALPGAPRPAVVDVLSALPDGRVRVQIDGEEQLAASSQPLTPGNRYVLQVQPTPTGLALKPLPDSPNLPTDVATAILRSPAASLPAALRPLQAELATLTTPQTTGGNQPVPAAVRDAASAVRDTLNTFLPTDPRPPGAKELQQLVENGGLHYEAKLARLADPEAAPAQSAAPGDNTREAASGSSGAGAAKDTVGADLKGDLLRLLQTVQDLGATSSAPAAQATLQGIEAQQATNTLAQANATPYLLQIPFPDGTELRTLSLSLEPQNRPDQPDAEQAGRFRMFMHVPLSDLGETWIDAGLAGDKFRATIYLDRTAVRDRVRAALPDLSTELKGDGFSEVLLDVRASEELPARHRQQAGAMQAGRPNTVSVLDVRV
jgi:hypothetical protein